jgi:hypothetical protein
VQKPVPAQQEGDLKGAERLIFHPNINTASVVVSWTDLEKFLATRANTVRVVALPEP